MKSPTIISVFLFISFFTVEGQTYFPFPEGNAHWNVYLVTSGQHNPPTDTTLLRYALHGDTTINEVLYMKLCLEKGDTINPVLEPIGGLREDEKRVFFIGQDFLGAPHDEEILLYDFNKQLDDTIFHYDNTFSVILGIDSILIGDDYRKRYEVDVKYGKHHPDFVVEGIGSIMNGLLGHITMIPTGGYSYWEHVCFRENGLVKYLNPVFADCYPSSWGNSYYQENDSIIDKEKVWYNYLFYYNSMSVNTELFGIGADTVINDTAYNHVLYASGGIQEPVNKYGYIRSNDGQVYYRTKPEKPEKIIYNFNISETEAITVYGLDNRVADSYFECQFICDSIRKKSFFDVERKVYYFHDPNVPDYNCESWIEGIGSMSGLLHNTDAKTGKDSYSLSCVTSQEEFLFKRSETEPCIKLAVGTKDRHMDRVLVYPNPIGRDQAISIRNASAGSNFNLYDVYGRLVLQKTLSSENASITIHLGSGYFLYRISGNKGMIIQTGQLIVH